MAELTSRKRRQKILLSQCHLYFEEYLLGKTSARKKLNLTLLFHRSYSTNSVKPKPGAYKACGQNDRNYFI